MEKKIEDIKKKLMLKKKDELCDIIIRKDGIETSLRKDLEGMATAQKLNEEQIETLNATLKDSAEINNKLSQTIDTNNVYIKQIEDNMRVLTEKNGCLANENIKLSSTNKEYITMIGNLNKKNINLNVACIVLTLVTMITIAIAIF